MPALSPKKMARKCLRPLTTKDIRLNLFKSFLEKQAALYNMAVPVTVTQNKKEKSTGNPAVHLVNEREKYTCPLCNTAHKDKVGKIRKYLFHEVCSVFA